MQTPAGYVVEETAAGAQATLTSFFEAAINYSTLQRFCHVVLALLITGALVAIAIAAYYKLKNRDEAFSNKLLKTGLVIAIVGCVLMVPAAHQQAVEVSKQQPAKLAAMEGQWETGPAEMSLFGWVDEEAGTSYTLGIPGFTSWLATGDFNAEFPWLNDFDEEYYPGNINAIYQSYHMMLYMFGIVALVLVLGLLVYKNKVHGKWALRIMLFGWVAALLAIEFGWLVAELGRQPWIVYGELPTADASSLAVTPTMLIITLVLFAAVYALIYFFWLKASFGIIKKGPQAYLEGTNNEGASAGEGAETGSAGASAGAGAGAGASAGAETGSASEDVGSDASDAPSSGASAQALESNGDAANAKASAKGVSE